MSLGISYKFSAIDNMSSAVTKIGRSVDKIDDKIKKIGNTSAKASKKTRKSFLGMGKAASRFRTKLAGIAIAGSFFIGMKKVISTGMDFEDSMAAVAAITGASGKELKLYSDSSIRLSKKYGVAASQIATGLKDIASGKSELLDTPDALVNITDKATELARAAGITVPESVRAMVGSLNQFGKGSEEAAKFADILTQGSVIGASEITDTAMAMKNAGGIAASAGLDFLETNAALQAMSKSSLKGAEAGTGLAGVIRRIKQTLPGLDIKELGFEETLRKIASAADSGALDLTETFGEHEKSILALLGNFKHFKRFKKELANAKGATSIAAEIRMATTSVRLAKVRAKMDQAMLKLFSRLEPMISKMVSRFSNWIDTLTDSDIQAFGDMIISIIEKLHSLLTTFVGFAKGAGKIAGATGQVMGAIVSGDWTAFTPELKATGKAMSSAGVPGGGQFNMLSGALRWLTENDASEARRESETIKIDINLNDPKNAVKNVKSKSEGRKSPAKLNMLTVGSI